MTPRALRTFTGLLALAPLVSPHLAWAGVPELGSVSVAQTAADVAVPDLSARPPPTARLIAVLVLSGEETGVPLSEIYSNARNVIEANTALTVAPLDVFSLDERAAVIRECAGRGACFAHKIRESTSAANVGLLLTVSADRLDEGFLLGFRLVDVETSRDVGAAGDEVPMGMSMLGAMEQQLPGVFPASIWGQIGVVQVGSTPEGAEVSVGGRSCVSPCELTRMLPGTYEVTVRKSGLLPWQGTVTVLARDTARVEAALEAPDSSITSSWVFWTAVGAAVLGGAVAAVLIARPTDRVVNICIAETEDLCR